MDPVPDPKHIYLMNIFFLICFVWNQAVLQILSMHFTDYLFGIVTSHCYPRAPGFDSRLYPRNFSGSIGSETGSTQPREDNWVAT